MDATTNTYTIIIVVVPAVVAAVVVMPAVVAAVVVMPAVVATVAVMPAVVAAVVVMPAVVAAVVVMPAVVTAVAAVSKLFNLSKILNCSTKMILYYIGYITGILYMAFTSVYLFVKYALNSCFVLKILF
jgi:hypothetical protein